MKLAQLAEAWAAFRKLPFPPHPQDDTLADWMFELLEVDGLYAGTVLTVLGGGRPEIWPRDNELGDLGLALDSIGVVTPSDGEILQQCREYLASLRRLHQALKSQ